MAGERLMIVTPEERERAIFRSRRMYQTDLESNLITSKDIGFAEGFQIGYEQGLFQGRSGKKDAFYR